MNHAHINTFWRIHFLVLILAVVIAEFPSSPLNVLIFCVLFGAAHYLRHTLWGHKYLHLDAESEKKRTFIDQLVLFGMQTTDKSEDTIEKNTLDSIITSKSTTYAWLSLGALIAFYSGLVYRWDSVSFSWFSILYFMMIAGLLFSTHLLHAMLPLLLSGLIVTITAFRDPNSFYWTMWSFYVLALFLCWASYRHSYLSFMEQKKKSQMRSFDLEPGLISAVVFCLGFAVLYTVLPHKSDEQALPQKSQLRTKLEQKVAEKFVEYQNRKRQEEESQALPSPPPGGRSGYPGGTNDNNGQKSFDLDKIAEGLQKSNDLSEKDMDVLKNLMANMGSNSDSPKMDLPQLSHQEKESLQEKLGITPEDLKNLADKGGLDPERLGQLAKDWNKDLKDKSADNAGGTNEDRPSLDQASQELDSLIGSLPQNDGSGMPEPSQTGGADWDDYLNQAGGGGQDWEDYLNQAGGGGKDWDEYLDQVGKGNGLEENELNNLKDLLAQNQNGDNSQGPPPPDISNEEIKELGDKLGIDNEDLKNFLGDKKLDPKELSKLAKQMNKNLQKKSAQSQETPGTQPSGEEGGPNVAKSFPGPEGAPMNADGDPGQATGQMTDTNNGTQAAETSSQARPEPRSPKTTKPHRSRKERVEDMKRKVSRIGNLLEKLFKGGLFLLVVALVFRFISKTQAKPKQNQRDQQNLNRRQRRKLRKRWQELKARKLSPEDEILETYSLALEYLNCTSHPRPPHLPPTHYSYEISDVAPKIGDPFGQMTDGFCQVLFSNQAVNHEEITQFRSAAKDVINYLHKGAA